MLDADGQLLSPSFVDAHLHLDKVYTFERAGDAVLREYTGAAMAGAMTAIEMASRVKDDYAEDAILENARRAVLDGLRNGVTHVQAFADTDTAAGLEAVKALIRLRDELVDVVRVDVVAFPQDGLLRDPGAEQLVRHAMDLGADVVGGIPWIEYDDEAARQHVDRMCRLAADHGTRVAMLTDDAGDPGLRTTEMLARAAIDHGLEGRVVACHARAIGSYAEPTFRRLLGLAQRGGAVVRHRPAHGAAAPARVRRARRRASRWPSGRTTSRTPTTRSAGTTCSRWRSSPPTCSGRRPCSGWTSCSTW